MGERIDIAGDRITSVTLKFEEALSMKEFYKFLHEWLVINGYCSPPFDGYIEKYYLEKIDQSNSKEIWFWWRTSRIPKDSPYFKFFLNVDVHVMGLKDAEVTIRGQKVKANKGEVEIMLNAWLEVDYKFNYEKNPFVAPFLGRFKRLIYRRDIIQNAGIVKREATGLIEDLKKWFELKPFAGGGETFNPPRGL